MFCVISLPALIVIIIIALACSSEAKKDRSWTLDLPKMVGHRCELEMMDNQGPFSDRIETGMLLDVDEAWLLMDCETYNGSVRKLIQISRVKDFKMIG